MTDRVEKNDLVIYFGTEWTVHSTDEYTALLRHHDDPEARRMTVRVGINGVRALVKAADR